MPDANGNFKGMSVPAAAWDRIFGFKARLDQLVEDEAPVLERLADGPKPCPSGWGDDCEMCTVLANRDSQPTGR